MDTVNENATFQHDDVFHRVDFAKKAMALINSHRAERGACVISIDAPWGMGKTTFLRMWMNELDRYNSEEPCQEPLFNPSPNMCIYYNAWENDYYENAFIPLLFTICGSLSVEKEEKEEREKKKRTMLQKVVSAGAGILGYCTCISTTQDQGLATVVGGLASTATESVMKMFESKDLDEIEKKYEKDKEIRREFRNAVSDLAAMAGKLYIFIDELDRCKPLFAIQTLECIKYFFNIPNVVFVFATDICQLSYSVAGVYGQGINGIGYLSKFFDYQLHLPVPDIRDLMRYAYPNISTDNTFREIMNEIRGAFILTPRETPVIIKHANIFWKALNLETQSPSGYNSYFFSYIVLLLTIKYKVPNQYVDLFRGMYTENINKDYFATIHEYISYTLKWVRKTPSELVYYLRKKGKTQMTVIDDGVEYYCEKETAWLSMIDAICNSQYTSADNIGGILQSTLEIFAIDSK